METVYLAHRGCHILKGVLHLHVEEQLQDVHTVNPESLDTGFMQQGGRPCPHLYTFLS